MDLQSAESSRRWDHQGRQRTDDHRCVHYDEPKTLTGRPFAITCLDVPKQTESGARMHPEY